MRHYIISFESELLVSALKEQVSCFERCASLLSKVFFSLFFYFSLLLFMTLGRVIEKKNLEIISKLPEMLGSC